MATAENIHQQKCLLAFKRKKNMASLKATTHKFLTCVFTRDVAERMDGEEVTEGENF